MLVPVSLCSPYHGGTVSINVGIVYLGEVGHHLLDEGPHGGNVDDLETFQVDRVIGVHVFVEFPQDTEKGHVGLSSSLTKKFRHLIQPSTQQYTLSCTSPTFCTYFGK